MTQNRTSASAGRLGDFFFSLPWDDYRDPEPGFRISGAVGGCLLFLPSGGMITVTPNRTSTSAGRLGDFLLFPPGGTVTVTPNRLSASAGRLGVFAFPSRGNCYRDPEPAVRIGGAVGDAFLLSPPVG